MEIPLLHYKSFSLDQIKSRCTFPFSFPDNKVVLKQLKQRTLRSGCFLLDRRKWRNPFDRIRCSSLGQNLQPRPRPKPSRIEEIESDVEETPVFKIPSVETCSRIVKFVILGRYREALELFEIFEIKGGFYVDSSTYDALVSACIQLKSIRGVKRVFSYMVSNGYEPDQYMRNRVLLMHVKCGMMLDARKLFDEMPERNLVTWNTMIVGLLDIGDYVEAFRLFLFMWAEFSDGGPRTFASMIRASAGLESISAGMQLHACTVKMGLGDDVFVSCALIDMYSKCGSIEDARFVFEEMPEKTTVAWNTVIAGYALHGYSEDALELYCEMRDSGVKMDHFTFSILVRICSRLASMEHARQAHAALIRHGFGSDMVANTSLVDFYSKWGRIEDARHVFDKMASKNVLSWNALIAGYGNHGRGADAIGLFECMVRERITPTHVTFLAVLSACCYSGLSERGWEIFQSMGRDFKVKPRAMHYACMIELLGREGLLDEAFALIRSSPFKPTANMWAALLTASRVHENLELAKLAAERLYGMGTEKLNNYIVLLNIYNSSGQLKEAAEVVQTLRKKGMRMHQACSWIEVKRKPHVFLFGDKTHILTEEIYQKVDSLILEISRHGYVPEKKARLPDVDKNEERMLKYHSEKLAIAFGLLNTPHWQSLQVVQGHRICDDCHKAIKLIAKVTKREIVVRDGSRFHRFKNGSCSCGDYW